MKPGLTVRSNGERESGDRHWSMGFRYPGRVRHEPTRQRPSTGPVGSAKARELLSVQYISGHIWTICLSLITHPGGLCCSSVTYSRYGPSAAPCPAGAAPVSVLAGLSPAG